MSSVQSIRVTISRLRPTATVETHCIEVGGDGHAPNLIAQPPGVVGIVVSPPISVGVQDRAEEDMNGTGAGP